jgi:uncharacterized membrane protein
MHVSRWIAGVPRLAAAAYPLLVFAVCRRGVSGANPWEMAALYLALSLPLILLALWAAGAMAGQRANLKIPIFIVLSTAIGAVVWLFALQLRDHYRWFFLMQDLAFFILLAYYFASSLQRGREPVCTFFARHVHHSVSPELLRYTRSVTKAWLAFFILTGCMSALLFSFASTSVWAFFTNILTPVLVVSVFVVENACRRFFLPPADRVGLLGTYRAIRRGRAILASAAQPKAGA